METYNSAPCLFAIFPLSRNSIPAASRVSSANFCQQHRDTLISSDWTRWTSTKNTRKHGKKEAISSFLNRSRDPLSKSFQFSYRDVERTILTLLLLHRIILPSRFPLGGRNNRAAPVFPREPLLSTRFLRRMKRRKV